MKRRLAMLAPLVACALFSQGALAQDSARTTTIIVPAAPGGANDSLARLLAAQLQESTGNPWVVVNKPGGNLVTGTRFVIGSPPDGRTLLLVGNSAVSVNPVLTPDLPYDADKDLAPISRLAVLEMMLTVTPSVPVNTVPELIAYSQANPNALNYGGGTPVYQLAMENFKHLSGAKATHIPYSGVARAIQAMLTGEVQLTISESTSAVPHVKSGKIKALAAIPRVSALPDLPSLDASVPGYNLTVWLGLFAPGGTPASTVATLHDQVVAVISKPEVRQRLADMGMMPVAGTPQEMTQTIQRDLKNVREIVKVANLKTGN